jgi:hypothetical protein
VLILDAVGHCEAIALGELLATHDVDATVVTTLPVPMALDGETQAAILPRAVQAGMTWRPSTALAFIADHEATLVNVLAGTPDVMSGLDTVVIRTTGLPNDALHRALDGAVDELHLIGDAVAVRPVDRAVYDGHLVARAL